MKLIKVILLTGALTVGGAFAQTTPIDGPVSKTVNIIDAFNSASEVEDINIYGFVNVTSNVSWEIDFSNDVDHVIGGFNLADSALNTNIQSFATLPALSQQDCGTALDQAPDDLVATAMVYLDPTTDSPTALKLADSTVSCRIFNVIPNNKDNLRLFMHVGQNITIKNYRGPDAEFYWLSNRTSPITGIYDRLYDVNGNDISAVGGEGVVTARTDGETGTGAGVTVTYLAGRLWDISQPGVGQASGQLKNLANEAIGAVAYSGNGTFVRYRLTSTQLYY